MIKDIFKKKNNEKRRNSRYFLDDSSECEGTSRNSSVERPSSTEKSERPRFVTRVKDKTKDLWQKIFKSGENEMDLSYEEDEKIAVPPEIKYIGEYLDKKFIN